MPLSRMWCRMAILKVFSFHNAIPNKSLVNMLMTPYNIVRAKEANVNNLVKILCNFGIACALK